MKRQVDARKELCPKPVIMTKKELDSLAEGMVTTIVDNKVAMENISRLAKSYNYDFTVEKMDGDDYHISITKGRLNLEDGEADLSTSNLSKDFTLAIGSDKMGSGEDALGEILMKSFIYTVKETAPLPATITLFNSGVNIACKESQILDDLRQMSEMGVEILVCGTCLDFYNIKDEIKVGEIANMYSIYEAMKNAKQTINIG